MDDSTHPGAENTITVSAQVHLWWNRETKIWEVYSIDLPQDVCEGRQFTTEEMFELAE